MENKGAIGKITQVISAVLDIKFPEGHLPEINDAIRIPLKKGGELIVEVAQHLGDDTVRCIALGPTDGLVRGMDAIATGGPISVPVGEKTLGRLFNVLGEPIDEIAPPQTKEHWEEVIIPITNGAFSDLLYSRWVKQRAADVDRWSGGRLGYVHIESMGDDSFRSVYSDILGKYNNREGIVIDTRFNGGGRLHEDIEILFSGQKYFTQVVRGRETCDMPSRRWNKPSIMVMCEANYSNAHGTPWVYSHRGLGKLVGMPVPGTMTSVSWERLQDPSLVFGIPVVGYRLSDGSYLENSQLEPDIKVANSPETIVKGEDTQLKAAVEELLKELEK